MFDINEIYDFVYKEFKIKLDAYKSVQMNRRIESFVSKTNIKTSRDFIAECRQNEALREQFLDLITINVTQFFRNIDIFFYLKDIFNKYLPKREMYRIWSSACSIGSEPYSVAMLLENMGIKNYEILATDIDRKVLEYAEKGIYKEDELDNIPSVFIEEYFLRQGDKFRIKGSIRNKVVFSKHDLILNQFPQKMDLILCRNVIIYFKREETIKIYNKFYDCLNDSGVVFIGATENIYDYQQIGFTKLGTFFYQKVVK